MGLFSKKKTPPGPELMDYPLWQLLKPVMTDKLLEQIAMADSGFGYEDNLRVLKHIHKTDILPRLLEWEPHEVLSLVSWEEKYKKPEDIYEVLYSCFLLLAATESDVSAARLEGQVEKIIVAIDCVAKLGDEWIEALYEALSHLVEEININFVEEDWLYFHLGQFILSVLGGHDTAENPHIADVMQAEQDILKFADPIPFNEDIMSYTLFDQRRPLWESYLQKTDRHLQEARLNALKAE